MGPRCGRKSLLGHDHHLNGDLGSLRLQRNMRWGVKMHVVRCRGREECGIDDARTFFGGDECQGDFRGCTLGVMPLSLRMPPQIKGYLELCVETLKIAGRSNLSLGR